MKISLPEDYTEISVQQYKDLCAEYERHEEAFHAQRRAIEILSGLERDTLADAAWEDIENASTKMNWLLSEPDPFVSNTKVKHKVKIDGVEYGFIPDWTRLTVGEYADLETMCNKGMFEYLEKIMSVMYRPITRTKNGMYEIERYEPSEDREAAMLKCPIDVVVGAVVFFCDIAEVLSTTMQPYLTNGQKLPKKGKRIKYTPNGDGMA